MPVADRAKQFLPFAAVKGLPEAMAAKERVVVPKVELSPEQEDYLNEQMHKLERGVMATVVYYDAKQKQYLKVTGLVARMEETSRILQIVNTKIQFDDIYDVQV
jgi:hypothetical protein